MRKQCRKTTLRPQRIGKRVMLSRTSAHSARIFSVRKEMGCIADAIGKEILHCRFHVKHTVKRFPGDYGARYPERLIAVAVFSHRASFFSSDRKVAKRVFFII